MRLSRTLAITGLAYSIVVAGSVSIAQSQLPFANTPANRPAVSPYLNLLNNGNRSGVSNYFTQVRPQIAARNELQRQQNEIGRLEQQVNRQRTSGIPIRGSQEIRGTGHETFFGNYLNYYTVPRRQ